MNVLALGLKRITVPRSVVSPVAASGATRFAVAILLLVDLAIAIDGELQVLGERVDDGDADAVEAAGDLVRGVVELTARVQDGHDDFRGGAALFGVDVRREFRGRCPRR